MTLLPLSRRRKYEFRPRSWLVAAVLSVLLVAVWGATAQAAKPQPVRPTGYVVQAVDEVQVQNLTCDELLVFLAKSPEDSMLTLAEKILNYPQHSKDTSNSLFGGRLTHLILDASGAPMCRLIVPQDWPPDPTTCRSEGIAESRMIKDLGMLAEANSGAGGGELQLLSEIERAAKLRNWRKP